MWKRVAVGVVVAGIGAFAAWPDPPDVDGKGHVMRARGPVPVRKGEACTVHLEAASRQGVNCRITIVCGHETIYGGKRLGGYGNCDAVDGKWVNAVDDQMSWRDGDPWLDLDVAAGLAVIRNERPDQELVVAFGVDSDGGAQHLARR